jgi:ATP-dependent RNA helicase DeaD
MMESTPPADQESFAALGLSAQLLQTIKQQGYETPTPIQAQCIPPLLEGRDLLGQAQTGTGKTAAFALPILDRLDLSRALPQALVLTPTRELALQVAEAFQTYAHAMSGFHVLPVYGGQGMVTQLRRLKRGVHVIVGTPGRVMDHLRRGSLSLEAMATLVLDEADEMLKMGFADDIEWIFGQAPEERQVALFSATVPEVTKRVARKHLREPVEIRVAAKTATVEATEQRHLVVTRARKLDLLTRILEVEEFDAMLIFARTKTGTVELADKLEAHGFAAEALNGDMSQQARERAVWRLRQGRADIVVATDVAARGLDVDRISHVVNYDIPYDPEAYVHRIGRTGRAGREGKALLFVEPRERRLLKAIERATRQRIPFMQLPTASDLSEQRVERFLAQVRETVATQDLDFYYRMVVRLERENDLTPVNVAAALTYLMQREKPFIVPEEDLTPPRRPSGRGGDERRGAGGRRDAGRREVGRGDGGDGRRAGVRGPRRERGGEVAGKAMERGRERRPVAESRERERGRERKRADRGEQRGPVVPSVRYRLDVGAEHGVSPGQIVGAIANEASLDGKYIGQIEIRGDHSLVDLPEGMPKEIFKHLQRVRVCNRPLKIERAGE